MSAKAFKKISVVETRARHFALGGGSTGTYREDLAALLGGHDLGRSLRRGPGMGALLRAEDVGRSDVHRAVQMEILALPEGQRRVARRLSCVCVAEEACHAIGIALPTARTMRKEWRATVKAAVRRLAATRLEQRSSLTLFRVCAPTAVWLRQWVLDMPATREAPLALVVPLLGCCCQLLPVTRLVRFAHRGQERPRLCDFCLDPLVGGTRMRRTFFSLVRCGHSG